MRGLTVLSLVFFCHSTSIAAFELSPLENKYKNNGKNSPFLEMISESVHEEITNQAVLCVEYAKQQNSSQIQTCKLNSFGDTKTDSRGYKYNPLIRGVWWNDDPNQNLFGASYAKWLAWMNDGKRIVKTGKNYLGLKKKIDKTYYMQYRSHFGDMQFLHSMANDDGISAQDTLVEIIAWAEFAYAVATEEIHPSTTLNNVSTKNFQKYFNHRPGWTVSYLYAPKWTLGTNSISDVALGSLLHLVQDSFSDAHTHRKYDSNKDCPHGRVVSFRSYLNQNTHRHGLSDKRSAWLNSTTFTPTQNPVVVSAKLIMFANNKADWETQVLPFLSDDVFCISTDSEDSSAGGYE